MNLSMDWKSGKKYSQQLEMKQVIGVPRHGEATAQTKMTMGLSVNGKNATKHVGVKLDSLSINVDLPAPAGDHEFDSTKPTEGNQDIAKFYQGINADPAKLMLDSRGKVLSVKGMEKLSAENALLSRFLGKDQMKNFLQQGWLVELPKAPVARGDSWPFQLKYPTPVGMLLIKGSYTLGEKVEKAGKPLVEIFVNGLVQEDFTQPSANAPKETDPEILKMQAMMMLAGVKVKEGKMSGSLFYDPSAKLMTSSQVDTLIRLSVAKYPENGKPTEIPIQQTMSLTLTEQKALK